MKLLTGRINLALDEFLRSSLVPFLIDREFLKYLLYILMLRQNQCGNDCKYFKKYRKKGTVQTRRSEMLIRQDFHPQEMLPPRMFLEQVMDSLSKAYCFLWDHKNDQNLFRMTWKELSVYYNKNAFRSNLRKLNNQGLLSYEESEDGIAIELIGWDEVASKV